MDKAKISSLLRNCGLIFYSDWVRFRLEKIKKKEANDKFRIENPEVKLPPDYLIYESFQLDYEKYYHQGRDNAKWLIDHLSKHYTITSDTKILDWGCGPGRIIRHLSSVIGKPCKLYGTDYNKKSIEWCAANLPDISFNQNKLVAELPYEDNFMDIIYGISIFTHLSKQMHYDWYSELYRVLKPGGILFLTTQGDNFRIKLLESEKQDFDSGNLVIRGKVKEGHRTYSAFHPKKFMTDLFKNTEILEHIETPIQGKWIPQDIWIIRKPAAERHESN